MKIKLLFTSYFNKYKAPQEPNNIYILIDSYEKVIDYNGYLDTRRGVHNFMEFSNLKEVQVYLKNNIAKVDRQKFILYKIVKEIK